MLGGPRLLRLEPGGAAWHFRRDRLATLSLGALVLIVAMAILAPLLTPYPDQGRGEPAITEKLKPPSAEHPFGTDALGRDVLARVLFGARTALIAGLAIQLVAVVFGTALGATAGYFGGWVDDAIMRITDVFLAFPPLLLAMTIAVVLEPSLTNSIIAISITWWPWYARIARGQAVSVRERVFEAPAHPYTQALLASTPVPDPERRRRRVSLRGSVPSPANPPPGCRFHTRCPHAMPVCRTRKPPRHRLAEDHWAACHLVAPLSSSTRTTDRDDYLQGLSETMSEWRSSEDEEASRNP